MLIGKTSIYSLSSWARKNAGPAADDLLGKISVITWRGMLTKLMLAVYEADNVANGRRADGWEMNAMVVDVRLGPVLLRRVVTTAHLYTDEQGCLYLEESNPPAKLTAKSASESSNALPSYYGYSFESYCTTAGPSSSATPPAPAPPHEFHVPNTNVQWCSVVKTNLGGFRALVGGEVDCVRSDAPADARKVGTKDFVELKTNLVIQSQRDEVNFERCALPPLDSGPAALADLPMLCSSVSSCSSTTSSPVSSSSCNFRVICPV